MATVAGYLAKVGVTTSSSTMTSADYVGGLKSIDFGRARELLETTSFASNTAGERAFIAGLKNVDISTSGDYDSANTPQGRLVTAYDAGSSVWIQYAPNGTAGWKVECKVESFNLADSFDGKAEFDCALKATGAVSTF